MKKYIALFTMTIMSQIIFANGFYEQLCTFNHNWAKYAYHIKAETAKSFHNDKEYIQSHLGHVIPILKSNPTTFLSYKQQVNRIKLIKFLEVYQKAGLFPVNNYREDRIRYSLTSIIPIALWAIY